MAVTLDSLDKLLGEITRESAKESHESTRQRALGVSQDFANRLQDRAIFRKLLADERLDGERFRWWFSQPHNRDAYDLDGWRGRIDRQMLKEKANGKL